jgi:hypothetical protein
VTAGVLVAVAADSLVGVSGDPGVVNSMADHYESVAASIRGAATRLRSLDAGSSSSDALDAFLAKAQQVSASLGKAEGRYGETGSALKAYASELSLAQEAAAPALANHRDAVDDLAAAERLVERYEQLALVATDEVTKQEHLDQAAAQRAKGNDARGRVALYARRLADAHASVETAATVAIAKIDDATDDGLDDTVWDDLGGAWDAGFAAFQAWMEENDSWISTVLDVLSVVGFALGLVAMFVPGLNVIVVLVMVSIVALSFARAAAGTATWNDFWLSTVSLVTFGIGGQLVSGAAKLTRGVKAERVEGLVRSGMTRRFASDYVARVWDRARPSRGDSFLFKAFGDESMAQMMHFLRSSRVGAFADDADTVAAITARLNGARVLSAADQVAAGIDSARIVEKRMRGGARSATRLALGGSW